MNSLKPYAHNFNDGFQKNKPIKRVYPINTLDNVYINSN